MERKRKPMKPKKDARLENFPKKWARVLEKACTGDNPDGASNDDFLDKVQQSSKEELDQMIIRYNENLAEISKDMELDQDLIEKKEVAKEAASFYTEGKKLNEAKAMYCIFIKKSL